MIVAQRDRTCAPKDVDGEKEVFDIDLEVGDDPTLTTTSTDTNEKSFNLTARYDFNWRP